MKINPKYEEAKTYYLNTQDSLINISKKFRICRGRFATYLKAQGIEVINRQNICRFNQEFFDVIDTENKAYWLGFLYADGYVATKENDIEVSLKSDDINHLYKLMDDLCFKNKKPFQDDIRCRLGFKNKHMRQSLIKLGCIPQKSLKLVFPTEEQVPSDLIRHFVRGYIDGDGSVMISKTGLPRLCILGTKDFLTELQLKMGWDIGNICRPRIRNNISVLEFGGKYVEKFLDDIYKNASVYLDRKYQRYLKIKDLPTLNRGKNLEG